MKIKINKEKFYKEEAMEPEHKKSIKIIEKGGKKKPKKKGKK